MKPSGKWTEKLIPLLGSSVHLLQAGEGDPLLILHGDTGFPINELAFAEYLAEKFTVYLPSQPGYTRSNPSDWEWVGNVRDLAIIMQQLKSNLGLHSPIVVGLGSGGWLAAEIATMDDNAFDKIVLVGATGLKPVEGEIYDQFIVNTETYVREGFHRQERFKEIFTDAPEYDQLDEWETNREMTCRIGWKPYMYNWTLPELLPGVSTSTLIVWGKEDRIVPIECAHLYEQALKNARVEILADSGHRVDLEKPAELARLVVDFAKS